MADYIVKSPAPFTDKLQVVGTGLAGPSLLQRQFVTLINNDVHTKKETEELEKITNEITNKIDEHLADDVTHLTADEKTKLTDVSDGAEVNQNAFSSIKVDDSIISATNKKDTFNLAEGTNIKLSTDSKTKTITINAPSSLKNPQSLIIEAKGQQIANYNGDTAVSINLSPQVIGTAKFTVSATAPSNPQVGDVWGW